MRRAAFCLVLLSAVALHATSSSSFNPVPQQASGGTIGGRVIAADGGEALRNARVTITGPMSTPRVFTDGDGRFLFANLTFGRYALVVRKAGYAQTRFGSRQPADPPVWIEITAESPAFSADMRLPRSGAISGRILDDLSEPIEMAQVFAERMIRTDGRVDAVTVASVTTDDLGEYRLGGLPGGRYIVWARRLGSDTVQRTVVNGRTVLERPDGMPSQAYYPSVTTLSAAQPVDVRAGEERASIDVTVAQRTPSRAMVRFSFIDADGKPMLATSVMVRLDDAVAGTAINTSGIGDNVAQRIDPGAWLLIARGVYAAGVAAVPIIVGSSDLSMSVPFQRGGRISGRVVMEGRSPPTAAIELEARPIEPALARMPGPPAVTRARVGDAFTLTDLIGTRELRIRSAPHGWVPKAILVRGRDLLDAPIEFKGDEQITGVEVVLTHDLAELSGTAADSSILVFPDDLVRYRDVRRVARWVRPNQDGRFVVDDLLPGTYCVLATNKVDDAQWANVDYLEQFRAHATRVTLKAGDRHSLVLKTDANP